jgi:PAS domain S-box-containing protein
MTLNSDSTATERERDFLAAVLNTMDALVVVLDHQGQIVFFNQSCEQATGYQVEEIQGHCLWEILNRPADVESFRTLFTQLIAGDAPDPEPLYWVTKQAEQRFISWSYQVLRNPQGAVTHVIGTGQDLGDVLRPVSGHRPATENAGHQHPQPEEWLGGFCRRIHQSLNMRQILNITALEVRQYLHVDRVLIFRFQPNWHGEVLIESIGPGPWTPMLGTQIYDPCFANLFAERYRQGRVLALENLDTAGLDPCHLDLLAQFQAKATLIVPILLRVEEMETGANPEHLPNAAPLGYSQNSDRLQNQLWGLLIAHHCSAPRPWISDDIEVLQMLVREVAIALQQAALYERLQAQVTEQQQVELVLQTAKDMLELKVTERTAALISMNQQLRLELTERQQTEGVLQVTQDRFSEILSIADDAIISMNGDQRITLFNQGASRIFGYQAAEAIGQSIDLLLPQQFTQAHRQFVKEYGQSDSQARRMAAQRSEVWGRRKDGTEFPAEASISKLDLGSDTVFTVILRDITERLQSQAALDRLHRQHELILNAIGEGLCGLALDAKITFVNPAAAKMLGYSIFELVHQPIDRILVTSNLEHPGQGPGNSAIYASLREGIVHQVTNAKFQRQDQSTFPVEYVSTPICEQDQIVGAVIAFKDISDRQVVERMKDEFISVVSHELRTPLTSIHGSLRMLASGLLQTQPEKAQRLLQIAASSTDRLVRLINDILDVERIESGKVEMVPKPCNAADLITQSVNTMQAMADKAEITLSVTPLSVSLLVDPDRMIQTLTNLLSNAIKFSNPGSTVWLTAKLVITEEQGGDPPPAPAPAPPNAILFAVKDQGRGIPAAKLDTIFERFQQVDYSDTRNQDGTGLGLAICRSIVAQHQGELWVESEVGVGSTFYVTLPLPPRESKV